MLKINYIMQGDITISTFSGSDPRTRAGFFLGCAQKHFLRK